MGQEGNRWDYRWANEGTDRTIDGINNSFFFTYYLRKFSLISGIIWGDSFFTESVFRWIEVVMVVCDDFFGVRCSGEFDISRF